MGVFEMIPQISYTGGFPLVYMPLSLIILISMIKDFVEDRDRRKADHEENEKIIEKWEFSSGEGRGGMWVACKSKDLYIGDIIKVH
jgi:phospholipid-transporting ATPase